SSISSSSSSGGGGGGDSSGSSDGCGRERGENGPRQERKKGSGWGLTPAEDTTSLIINSYNNSNDSLLLPTQNAPEMVLQMLDTLVTAQEPFYADYPSYHEQDTITTHPHNHHQHHHHHHHHQHHHQQHNDISRVIPPVSLDATTHTPGIISLNGG
ncbi:hypothetical protein PV327_011312, partial [Microctonus hyperodae]